MNTMSADLSMQGHMNQVCYAVKEKQGNRVAERRRDILYLIWNYLGENGYEDAQNVLASESQLSPHIKVCDNIDLETILIEYENYYRMKFNKLPTFCKKVAKDAGVAESKTKLKSINTLKKIESNTEKMARVPVNSDSTSEMNLAVTITPIFTEENKHETFVERKSIEQRERHSKLSKFIEKLYPVDSELRKIAEEISQEVVNGDLNVSWNDVVGLDNCKIAINQAVVYPLKYPVFFAGQFSPWKGILLYGAPGTGKTMLAKAAATECNCTFFNVTASSLVSKWRGDSEKCIRVLFELAYSQSPTIIFIDEIDWITTKVKDGVLSEAAKRFRSELLARMDGLVSTENSNVVILAATNSPWDIDAALLRRLEKRIYVPLPDCQTKCSLFALYLDRSILRNEKQLKYILEKSEHYSGADIKMVCKEAWMLQLTPMWTQLEKGEPPVASVKYEITDFTILANVLEKLKPTIVSDAEYRHW